MHKQKQQQYRLQCHEIVYNIRIHFDDWFNDIYDSQVEFIEQVELAFCQLCAVCTIAEFNIKDFLTEKEFNICTEIIDKNIF